MNEHRTARSGIVGALRRLRRTTRSCSIGQSHFWAAAQFEQEASRSRARRLEGRARWRAMFRGVLGAALLMAALWPLNALHLVLGLAARLGGAL